MIRWRPTLPRPPPEINTHLGHYQTIAWDHSAIEAQALHASTPGEQRSHSYHRLFWLPTHVRASARVTIICTGVSIAAFE